MKKGVKGSLKPIQHGLAFEERVSFENLITSFPGYEVIDDVVYFKGAKMAELYGKYKLYNKLLKPRKIDFSKIISKRLIPDEAVLILKDNTLYVIEIKFQHGSGSVDEKLQTCDFKIKQYTKLLAPLNIQIKFAYVLSDWFKKKEYKDTLDYVESVGCSYFFNVLPLDFLGLPKPISSN